MTDIALKMLIDTREQNPWSLECETEGVKLPVGDYGLPGFSDLNNPRWIVERKSLGDLIGSLTQGRDRFMREIEKLRVFTFAAIVIEARESDVERGEYRSEMPPQSVLQSIAAIQVRNGIHIIWAGDRTGAARAAERLARQFLLGVLKEAKRIKMATKKGKKT